MSKNWFKMFFVSISAFGMLALVPAAAMAAADECVIDTVNDPLGLNCVGQGTGGSLTQNDPRIIAARIINVVLGVLGTIATVLIFYAGFLWMTAAGNEEQITKAKGIMSAAVIGLVIILASYSISTFLVKNITSAVTGTP